MTRGRYDEDEFNPYNSRRSHQQSRPSRPSSGGTYPGTAFAPRPNYPALETAFSRLDINDGPVLPEYYPQTRGHSNPSFPRPSSVQRPREPLMVPPPPTRQPSPYIQPQPVTFSGPPPTTYSPQNPVHVRAIDRVTIRDDPRKDDSTDSLSFGRLCVLVVRVCHKLLADKKSDRDRDPAHPQMRVLDAKPKSKVQEARVLAHSHFKALAGSLTHPAETFTSTWMARMSSTLQSLRLLKSEVELPSISLLLAKWPWWMRGVVLIRNNKREGADLIVRFARKDTPRLRLRGGFRATSKAEGSMLGVNPSQVHIWSLREMIRLRTKTRSGPKSALIPVTPGNTIRYLPFNAEVDRREQGKTEVYDI
ncbi:hypothetical protein CI109_101075 [Kwoniella shandongensis]|uniref:Uncharacterized protein n=1 Tax=Kwoniella shandongensis TaxID=1734106 RepID=A0A5M6C4V0_9TREE|nr:uncharacterized protein CI109_001544 [Kwoniella shandongensis]KAA5530138.1 hypothetical protein CI109_001544 [Kwoniella shandongensis]